MKTPDMQIYVVIATTSPLDDVIRENFDEQNRSQAASGVWFVRSARLSTSDVMNDLGIGPGAKAGIVVAAQYYNGVGPADLVEKLGRWREQS